MRTLRTVGSGRDYRAHPQWWQIRFPLRQRIVNVQSGNGPLPIHARWSKPGVRGPSAEPLGCDCIGSVLGFLDGRQSGSSVAVLYAAALQTGTELVGCAGRAFRDPEFQQAEVA